MAYNVLNAYDARARIPQFQGLMQYGNEGTGNPCYAREAVNMDTPGGVLQPCANPELLKPELDSPIETLARFYRRWHARENEQEVLVAASGGKLYYALTDAVKWTELPFPDGVTEYASNRWSWVTYEINEEGKDPIDILLLSNAQDGMVYVRGDTLAVHTVVTPYKFGVITRYAERIWGGAAPDEPDMLAYSKPFDPTDWTANTEIPEDGGGDIRQPSWDGDSFTHMVQLGSQLICFKKQRIWRVLGTDPGEYTFKEQYGGGASYPGTVAVDGEKIYMLSDDGVLGYDGLNAAAFMQEYAKDVWARMNRAALYRASACMHRGKYYLSVALDKSETNNAVIVYNTTESTWLLREDLRVERWLSSGRTLYFTSSVAPGRIYRYIEDGWEENAEAVPCRWVTPWNDLNYRDYNKGGFSVYLTVECLKELNLSISIQTEKKKKTKVYTVKPPEGGKYAKQKRMFFGGRGRRFRLIIESSGTAMWRLIGGIETIVEIDGD